MNIHTDPNKHSVTAMADSLDQAQHAFNVLVTDLKHRVLEQMRNHIDIPIGCYALSSEVVDSVKAAITSITLAESSAMKIELTKLQGTEIINQIVAEFIGYGPIAPLLNQEQITEIMINAPDEIFIEEDGHVHKVNITFEDENHVRNLAAKIVEPLGRKLDDETPFVDTRLPDGSRVNIIIPPVSLRGTMITIRKFRKQMFTIDNLIQNGCLTRQLSDFLSFCIQGRLNIVISGGTGSGKTTLLNVLSRFIPAHERLITIEDAAELQLHRANMGILESRRPNHEGKNEITARQLLRNALRMRPDRIIIGEIRGDEAFDMLQSMNTGHDGSMTTVHANTPRDALRRIETMTLLVAENLALAAIRAQIASAIHLIVQVQRQPDGQRQVIQVSEISGTESGEISMQDLYVMKNRQLQPTGIVPHFSDLLKKRGLELPTGLFITI